MATLLLPVAILRIDDEDDDDGDDDDDDYENDSRITSTEEQQITMKFGTFVEFSLKFIEADGQFWSLLQSIRREMVSIWWGESIIVIQFLFNCNLRLF